MKNFFSETTPTEQELENYEANFIHQGNCSFQIKDFYVVPPVASKKSDQGNNVLHFNSGNRPLKSRKTDGFIDVELKSAKKCESDTEILIEAVKIARELNNKSNFREGIFLEFGFCTGKTINFLAALGYDKEVFGFDSGEGLPKDWEFKPTRFKKGTFKFKFSMEKLENGTLILSPRKEGEKPIIPFIPFENVNLILGQIGEVIEDFSRYLSAKKVDHIELIHVDTDIYDTCKEIFKHIGAFIKPGKTVVILDEGYNWIGENGEDDAWEKSELLAAKEFAENHNFRIEYLAYNYQHQQLVLVFHEK